MKKEKYYNTPFFWGNVLLITEGLSIILGINKIGSGFWVFSAMFALYYIVVIIMVKKNLFGNGLIYLFPKIESIIKLLVRQEMDKQAMKIWLSNAIGGLILVISIVFYLLITYFNFIKV